MFRTFKYMFPYFGVLNLIETGSLRVLSEAIVSSGSPQSMASASGLAN